MASQREEKGREHSGRVAKRCRVRPGQVPVAIVNQSTPKLSFSQHRTARAKKRGGNKCLSKATYRGWRERRSSWAQTCTRRQGKMRGSQAARARSETRRARGFVPRRLHAGASAVSDFARHITSSSGVSEDNRKKIHFLVFFFAPLDVHLGAGPGGGSGALGSPGGGQAHQRGGHGGDGGHGSYRRWRDSRNKSDCGGNNGAVSGMLKKGEPLDVVLSGPHSFGVRADFFTQTRLHRNPTRFFSRRLPTTLGSIE